MSAQKPMRKAWGALVATLCVAALSPDAFAEEATLAPLAATAEVGTVTPVAPAANLLFADDFSFPDAGWSTVDAEIRDGALIHSPKPDQWSNAFYYGSLFEDADIRVRARIKSSTDAAQTAASLAFWHADGRNFYAFAFWPQSAFARVTRFQDGNSIAVVERKIEPFELSPDGSFELSVATTGNIATIAIDGHEIGRFKGQPPQNGWKLGTFASAPKAGTAIVEFKDLKVLRP